MSQETICGVYKITHIASGKSYIGISKNIYRRWSQHRASLNKKDACPLLQKAFAKHGIESFSWQIIEQCEIQHLEEREKHWISVFDTFRNGYNLTTGGSYASIRSEETKKKISESTIGKPKGKRKSSGPKPDSVKEKIRASLMGHKFSDETRKKMSEAQKKVWETKDKSEFVSRMKSIKISDETRQKMSASQKAQHAKRLALMHEQVSTIQ